MNRTVENNIVSESISEMKERDRRKSNLLLFNVEESSAESLEERKSYDTEKVRDLFRELDLTNEVSFSKPVRLPKSKLPKFANNPRPLRITLNSEDERREVLQRLKNAAEGSKVKLKNVYVKRDLTRLERMTRKALAEKNTPTKEAKQ